ncbi:hypothetical protein BpHYR1_013575 [Brachionus plicatilis]|uniref:Uncharacterized protein n=1 Tax=Brachionus plicatilis TaxID=10195 RepID=A0A3M7QA54_BRAPC|nr:hypothetical protein BpHYR1_013575 [Brachionus plicatilis]
MRIRNQKIESNDPNKDINAMTIQMKNLISLFSNFDIFNKEYRKLVFTTLRNYASIVQINRQSRRLSNMNFLPFQFNFIYILEILDIFGFEYFVCVREGNVVVEPVGPCERPVTIRTIVLLAFFTQTVRARTLESATVYRNIGVYGNELIYLRSIAGTIDQFILVQCFG